MSPKDDPVEAIREFLVAHDQRHVEGTVNVWRPEVVKRHDKALAKLRRIAAGKR